MKTVAVGRGFVVLLAIVALGVSAATIDSGTFPDSDLTPGQSPPPLGDRGGWRSGDGGGQAEPTFSFTSATAMSCPPVLTDARVLAGIAVLLLLAGAVVYRATRSVPQSAVVAGVPLVGVLVTCQSLLLAALRSLSSVFGGLPAPLILFAGVLAVVVGSLVVALVRSDRTASVVDVSRDDADEELEAVGRIAGETADRIEADADVTNEVYRAWAEMTDHLDVPNPDARSPEEFADAAVAAGMSEPDLMTLTDLFREVRYGGRDPGDRAGAAVDALRGIEETYGTEGEEP